MQKLIIPKLLKDKLKEILNSYGYVGVKLKDFTPGEKQYNVVSNSGRLHIRINHENPVDVYAGVLMELCAKLTDENTKLLSKQAVERAAVVEMKAVYEESQVEIKELAEKLARLEGEHATALAKIKSVTNSISNVFGWLHAQTTGWPGKRGVKFRELLMEAYDKIPIDKPPFKR